MSGTSILGRIAEWLVGVTFEDLPRRVVEEAKNQTLDMIASVHAGHFSDAGRAVSRTMKAWGGDKEATLIPSGERVSVPTAVFGNTALSLALDYDNYLFGGRTGLSAVLANLALAEKLGSGNREVLVAQVLANEVAGRLGAAVSRGAALDSQVASCVHAVGGAVVAARLLKLERPQVEHALALALSQPNSVLWPAFVGSDARLLAAAATAPLGVQAAELAANGLRGAVDLFEGDAGFLARLAPQPLQGAFEGLGKIWLTDTVTYKPYPGSATIHSAIDCVVLLARQHQIDARAIRSVRVAATAPALEMEARASARMNGPESLASTLGFSIAYNVAAALLDRELTARQFTRERIKDPAVWTLAGKVEIVLDEELTRRQRERQPVKAFHDNGQERWSLDLGALDPGRFVVSAGARVKIELENGRTFEMEQEIPFGAAGRPFDERRRLVEEKFRRETRYTLRKERMEKAIELVHQFDAGGGSHVREFVRMSCSEKS